MTSHHQDKTLTDITKSASLRPNRIVLYSQPLVVYVTKKKKRKKKRKHISSTISRLHKIYNNTFPLLTWISTTDQQRTPFHKYLRRTNRQHGVGKANVQRPVRKVDALDRGLL